MRISFAAFVIIGLLSACRGRPTNNGFALKSDAVAQSGTWLTENKDIDSDGDGLSNFQETYKYFTDPNKADTDGDGIADGDLSERREYAYTIRNEMEVLKPVDIAAMQTDYQDAKILEDRANSLVIEVIYYPLNTVVKSISANPNWREDYKDMEKYLRPTQTSNWDERMRAQLLTALSQAGINPAQLSDKELVERVSTWIMTSFKGNAPFVAYFVDIADGKANLIPELLPRLKSDNQDNPDFDINRLDEMLQLGTFGRTLFNARKIGSCTPTAILFSTILRAMGIPTRIILTVPVIDPNSPTQQASINSKITHPLVKDTIVTGIGSSRGWNSHTYNEVFVGKRWVKLNYNTLGQNNLSAGYFGLMTQVNTFVDWSDGNMSRTWGMRIAVADSGGQLNPALSSQNQYMSRSLSDLFGTHANVVIPVEHKNLTINGVFWPHDSGLSPGIRDINFTAATGKIFLTSFEEFFPDQDYPQYGRFLQKSPRKIRLVADGQPPVMAELAALGYHTEGTTFNGVQRIFVVFPFMISNADYGAMPSGVSYRIEPINDAGVYTLSVKPGVTFKK